MTGDEELELDELGRNIGLEGGIDRIGPTDPQSDLLSADVLQASLIVRSCSFAETHFGLRVSEMDAPGSPARWGPVHRVHSPGSLHYAHRAADITGTEQAMRRFCDWALRTHLDELAELIHNPGASVKNGRRVPSSFWGSATWSAHRNHVHFAI